MTYFFLFTQPVVAEYFFNSILFWFFFSLCVCYFLADQFIVKFNCSIKKTLAINFIFLLSLLIFPSLCLILCSKAYNISFLSLSSFFFNICGSFDQISTLFVFMVHLVGLMVLSFMFLHYYHINQHTSSSTRLGIFALFLMIFVLDILFLSTNFFIIFIAAEISLLPLSFLMLKENTIFWRSLSQPNIMGGGFFEKRFENKRPLAFYYLILFTVISGGLGLIGFVILYSIFGTLSIPELTNTFVSCANTTYEMSDITKALLNTAIFFIVSWIVVKVPLVPVHIWLPKAHVEGSTESSMLLAGIVLKITTYVLIRLSYLPLYVVIFSTIEPFFLSIATLTTLFGALGALSTTDLKRLTAYSSVSHMGTILSCGFLISFSSFALQSYIILLMTHTLISTAMFLVVGCIYKMRSKFYISRNRLTYSGLLFFFPHLFLFGLIIFANLNIPLTLGFAGELGALVSIAQLGVSPVLLVLGGSFILLVPMLMIIAQLLLGSPKKFDYDFFLLIHNNFTNSAKMNFKVSQLFINNCRLFSFISYSKNYEVFHGKVSLMFTSIILITIGFGLIPFVFAHIAYNENQLLLTLFTAYLV